MVNLKINGQAISVPEGTTILEAAKTVGIRIPTLCYLKDINAIGACRVCVVEVKGARSLVASCVYPVSENMEVITNSKRVLSSRKTTVELLLSDHAKKCLTCSRSFQCELQDLARECGCEDGKYVGAMNTSETDTSTAYLVRDNSKCILCKRCVAACREYQGIAVIGTNSRGFEAHVGCAFEKDLGDSPCVGCGQCIAVCPTGALRERDELDDVIDAMNNPSKHVIMAPAPAVRAAIGEEFGYPAGTNQEGRMVAAMKRLGADEVFDVDFAADVTIMEEGYEFINRVKKGGVLPMMTSCSPAWIKFMEHYYPDQLDHLSSCKSPQQMFGAIVKTYYAEKLGKDPKDIVVVTVMPCTAKKFEKERSEMQSNPGVFDIDNVLTTRELARLIRRQGIQFQDLPEENFDAPLGVSTGAGTIFGVTGGVMEAALRTVREVLDGKPSENVEFREVRGMEGIKEATYHVGGMDVNVAVASGLKNANALMQEIRNGTSKYHFIEIMSCPGGCVNGGGQPIKKADERNFTDYRALRASALYSEDEAKTLRKSHENPVVKEVYDKFFGAPNSHKAHEVLHTTYRKREMYK